VGDPASHRHDSPLLEQFRDLFEAVGGEVVEFASQQAALMWLEDFARGFDSMVFGATVPAPLRFQGEETEPPAADLSISMARYAIAETGSLVLDARDGRLVQLLPHTHVVLVWMDQLRANLLEFLQEVGEGTLPSAMGLHSGPSKSADIGQVVVQGIHGPGRVIAGILQWDRQR
jgi:L-lactate dehydrogenase complex protein LldG